MPPTSGRIGVAILAVAAALTVLAPVGRASADGTTYRTWTPESQRSGIIFFEGDSITAMYDNRPSSPMQGYWSKLASQLAMTPITDAQDDSGFVIPGELYPHQEPRTFCNGTTFAERLTPAVRIRIRRATLVVVEGGKNDFHTCKDDQPNGEEVRVDNSTIRKAVSAYLDQIAAIRTGLDPATVYVVTPWGMHNDTYNRHRIPPIIKAEAGAHGFQYVSMGGVLDPDFRLENTLDSIHPDADGTTDLARAFMVRSDIADRARALQREIAAGY